MALGIEGDQGVGSIRNTRDKYLVTDPRLLHGPQRQFLDLEQAQDTLGAVAIADELKVHSFPFSMSMAMVRRGSFTVLTPCWTPGGR